MRHPGHTPTNPTHSSDSDAVYADFLKILTSTSICHALDWLADTDEEIVQRAQADKVDLVHAVVRCDDHDTRMHCFRRLRALGANFSAVDKEGSSPLHVAVRAQDVMAARILLHLGSSPNARDSAGRTPLHWSAEAGRITLTFALIDAGAWQHVRDHDGKTYADLAPPALKKRLEMIQTVRGLSAKIDLLMHEQGNRQQMAHGEGEYRLSEGE